MMLTIPFPSLVYKLHLRTSLTDRRAHPTQAHGDPRPARTLRDDPPRPDAPLARSRGTASPPAGSREDPVELARGRPAGSEPRGRPPAARARRRAQLSRSEGPRRLRAPSDPRPGDVRIKTTSRRRSRIASAAPTPTSRQGSLAEDIEREVRPAFHLKTSRTGRAPMCRVESTILAPESRLPASSRRASRRRSSSPTSLSRARPPTPRRARSPRYRRRQSRRGFQLAL